MIHAFALEPKLVATWGKRDEYRFIRDKFGLGTPRVFLELPTFSKWKREVYDTARGLALSEQEMKRIEDLFRMFGEHKCRRADPKYDGLVPWLENAELEVPRRPWAAIVAIENPRKNEVVLEYDQLGAADPRWAFQSGLCVPRTPEDLARALSPMLTNCRELHLIDPHFGPETARHCRVLEALMEVVANDCLMRGAVRVHCEKKSTLEFFEEAAARMAVRLPRGVAVEFVRWREKEGGEKLHNRYVLTDVGGVSLGVGLDAGQRGETDDLHLLSRAQYERRWAQYVGPNGDFECVDQPSKIAGTRQSRMSAELARRASSALEKGAEAASGSNAFSDHRGGEG